MKKVIILILSTLVMSGCTISEAEQKANEDGDITHSHIFNVADVKPEALAKAATCTEPAYYYYSCACGEIDRSNAFPSGEPLGHQFNYVSNGDATHLVDGTKTATCERCGQVSTVTDEGSRITEHSFTIKDTSEEFQIHGVTCEEPGLYYYSCECGEHGDETFEITPLGHHKCEEWTYDETHHWHACENNSEEKLDYAFHNFNLKIKNASILVSEATCENDAVYHYSCECGAVSKSETFVDEGSKLGHNPVTDYTINETHHWHECLNDPNEKLDYERHNYNLEIKNESTLVSPASCQGDAVYAKSCVCGKISSTDFFIDEGTRTQHEFGEFEEVHIENLDCVKVYGAVCKYCGCGDLLFNDNVTIIESSSDYIYISDKRFNPFLQEALMARIAVKNVNGQLVYTNDALSGFEGYIVGEDYDLANRHLEGGQYVWNEKTKEWKKEITLIFEFDAASRITLYRMQDDDRFLQYAFTYGEQIVCDMTDNVSSTGSYHIGKVILNDNYQYIVRDTKGFDKDDKLTGETRITNDYDENGNIIKTVTEDFDTTTDSLKVTSTVTNEYDAFGNCIRKLTNKYSESYDIYYDYNLKVSEFDNKGNLLSEKNYYRSNPNDEEMELNYSRTYTYDSLGRKLSYEYAYSKTSGSFETYAYDSYGNLVELISGSLSNGIRRPNSIKEYRYDAIGNLLYEGIGSYRGDGTIAYTSQKTMTYDPSGRIATLLSGSSYGNPTYTEYDYNGCGANEHNETIYQVIDGGNIFVGKQNVKEVPSENKTIYTVYIPNDGGELVLYAVQEIYNDKNQNRIGVYEKTFGEDGSVVSAEFTYSYTDRETGVRTDIRYNSFYPNDAYKTITKMDPNTLHYINPVVLEKYEYKYTSNPSSVDYLDEFVIFRKTINEQTSLGTNNYVYENISGVEGDITLVKQSLVEMIDGVKCTTEYQYSNEKGQLIPISRVGRNSTYSSESIPNTEYKPELYPTMIIETSDSEEYSYVWYDSIQDFVVTGKTHRNEIRYYLTSNTVKDRFQSASMSFFGESIDKVYSLELYKIVTTIETYKPDSEGVMVLKDVTEDVEYNSDLGINWGSTKILHYSNGYIVNGSYSEFSHIQEEERTVNTGEDKDTYPELFEVHVKDVTLVYAYDTNIGDFVISKYESYANEYTSYYKINNKGRSYLYKDVVVVFDANFNPIGETTYIVEKCSDDKFDDVKNYYKVTKYDELGNFVRADYYENWPYREDLEFGGDLGYEVKVNAPCYLVGTGMVTEDYIYERHYLTGSSISKDFRLFDGDKEIFIEEVNDLHLTNKYYYLDGNTVKLSFSEDFNYDDLKNVVFVGVRWGGHGSEAFNDFEVSEDGTITINDAEMQSGFSYELNVRNSNGDLIASIVVQA